MWLLYYYFSSASLDRSHLVNVFIRQRTSDLTRYFENSEEIRLETVVVDNIVKALLLFPTSLLTYVVLSILVKMVGDIYLPK